MLCGVTGCTLRCGFCRWYHLPWFCEVEIVHREEAEAYLPEDVTASSYDRQITTKYCPALNVMLYKICVYQLISFGNYAITKDKGMYGSFATII